MAYLSVRINNSRLENIIGLFSNEKEQIHGTVFEIKEIREDTIDSLKSGELRLKTERLGFHWEEVTDDDLYFLVGKHFESEEVTNHLKKILPLELWL